MSYLGKKKSQLITELYEKLGLQTIVEFFIKMLANAAILVNHCERLLSHGATIDNSLSEIKTTAAAIDKNTGVISGIVNEQLIELNKNIAAIGQLVISIQQKAACWYITKYGYAFNILLQMNKIYFKATLLKNSILKFDLFINSRSEDSLEIDVRKLGDVTHLSEEERVRRQKIADYGLSLIKGQAKDFIPQVELYAIDYLIKRFQQVNILYHYELFEGICVKAFLQAAEQFMKEEEEKNKPLPADVVEAEEKIKEQENTSPVEEERDPVLEDTK